MKKICLVFLKILLVMLFIFKAQSLFAQTEAEKQKIILKTDVIRLNEFAKQKDLEFSVSKAKALAMAKEKGWVVSEEKEGKFIELMSVSSDGDPIYYTTYNIDAAKSVRTNTLHYGGALGLNLEGQNMTAHVWDAGLARTTHQEYDGPGGNNRFSIGDGTTTLSYHSAHVTGTIIASGFVAKSKGMSPQGSVIGYEWNNDISEGTTAAANGMLLSNHSYGYIAVNIPDQWFGAYGADAVNWDNLMYNAPYYLMVKAAGNDGDDNTSNASPLAGNALYDKLSGQATAKNNIVVANAQDAIIEGGELYSVAINSSSSEGPTDDFRIKPDITGNGTGLYSTYETADNAYNTISGTSMASPNVTGTLLLLQQHYNNINSNFMRAATLKGLALHTADDIGPVGPDAVYGWGLLNAKRAAKVISNNALESIISELTLTQGGSYSINVAANGVEDLTASISWTDPAGISNTVLNSSTPALINDLDIRITQSSNTYFPYKLTSITSNSTGDNIVDPYEKIIVPNSTCGTIYTITVTHKGTLTTSQNYSLIVTGIKLAANDAGIISARPQVSSCGYSNNTPIEIKIGNYGNTSLGNILVAYEVRKANHSLVGNGNYTISSLSACNINTNIIYADMSVNSEVYTINVSISVSGDVNNNNNSFTGNYSPVNIDLSTPASTYSQGFEAGSLEAVGWSQQDVNGDGGQGVWYIYQDAVYAHSGAGFAINFAGANTAIKKANDWLFSPCLYLISGQNYQVTYWVRMIQSKAETIRLCIGTSPNDASMTTTLATAYTPTTAWVQKTQTFTVSSNGVYYLGWHSLNLTDSYAPSIDDVIISNTSTVVLPQVTTATVLNIVGSSATGGGQVTNIGSSAVTERGIVYSKSINPSTSDNKVQSGSGLGAFSGVAITPLDLNTVYYVRAYATNSSGTSYGKNVSFTTFLPEITSVSTNNFFKDKGATISIYGSKLLDAASVDIGGTLATINSNTATLLSVTFPAGVYANNILTVTTSESGSATYNMNLSTRNIIPVGGGTDFHTSIQGALNGLFAWYGTTSFDAGELAGAKYINIYNGTYNEAIIPNISLNPSSTNKLVIQSFTGESPVINATGKANGINLGALNNVTITGLTIYGATSDNIYTEGDNNTLMFNKTYNSVGASGIKLSTANNSIVKNNLVYSNYNYGIHLVGSSSVETDNNTIYDNGHSQIGSQTVVYAFSGSVAVIDAGTINVPVTVSDNFIINKVRVLNMNITHTWDSDLNIFLVHPDATQVELTTGNGGSGDNYINTNFDDAASTSITAGSPPFTGTFRPEGLLSAFNTKNSSGIWKLKVTDALAGDAGTLTGWQLEITYTANSLTGCALYVESGTGISLENNILSAKSGNDAFYALRTENAITVASQYNNYYSLNTNLFNYNGTIGNTGPISTGDISFNPHFVNAPLDFHLKSTAGAYVGGIWPPTTTSGGTWTNDASITSPSIDAGNPSDDYSNEPASGLRINQGAYGNTAQASKSACTPQSTPIVETITQPTCFIATGSVVLSGLPATGTWTLTRTPGSITTTGSGNSTTISGLAAGTYTWTVTNLSGCTSPSSADVVLITPQCLSHFEPVWWPGSGMDHMNLYALTATLDGVALQPGDEIGIFDGDVCVGMGVLTQELNGTIFLSMVASRDDPGTPLKDGYSAGNPVTYKVWDSGTGSEVSNTQAGYTLGVGIFAVGTTSAFNLSAWTSITQNLSLSVGWNIMSFAVQPTNMTMLAIVNPLITAATLTKIQDERGNAIEQLPAPINWVDNIGQMKVSEGYKIKVTTNTTLSVTGQQVTLPYSISLDAGWNIMGYPSMTSQGALTAFDPLITAATLVKVQDEAGNAIEKLPAPIGWIDNVKNLTSGHGYKVKTNINTSLAISNSAKGEYQYAEVPMNTPTHFKLVYTGNGLDQMNIYISKPTVGGVELKTSDEIGVFDGDHCVGAVLIDNPNGEYFMAIVSLDDPNTPEKDGFKEGNNFELRLWDNQAGIERKTQKAELYKGYNKQFERLGTSVLAVDFEKVIYTSLGDAFPNPSTDKTTFTFQLEKESKVRLEIYNMEGDMVKVLVDHKMQGGMHKIDWDNRSSSGTRASSGVYFYRLKLNNFVQTKKLVIR